MKYDTSQHSSLCHILNKLSQLALTFNLSKYVALSEMFVMLVVKSADIEPGYRGPHEKV